jgi:hypothetical protein
MLQWLMDSKILGIFTRVHSIQKHLNSWRKVCWTPKKFGKWFDFTITAVFMIFNDFGISIDFSLGFSGETMTWLEYSRHFGFLCCERFLEWISGYFLLNLENVYCLSSISIGSNFIFHWRTHDVIIDSNTF